MSSSDLMFSCSLLERRAAVRELKRKAMLHHVNVDDEFRLEVVASESRALQLTAEDAVVRLRDGAPSDARTMWRMRTRLAFEELFEGPEIRDVAGWDEDDILVLDTMDSEQATPEDASIRIYQAYIDRGLRSGTRSSVQDRTPALIFDRSRLPATMEISRIASPSRLREPLILTDAYAYPVSSAWMFVPELVAETYSRELHAWMTQHWPEALELCVLSTHPERFDREAFTLAIEAFARNMTLEYAAGFTFGALAADVERVV